MAKDSKTTSKKVRAAPPEKGGAKKGGAKTKAVPDEKAVFGNDVDIFCGQRLPQYDVGGNKAYKAVSKSKGSGFYAVVCQRHLLPRRSAASVYSGIVNPSLASMIAYGKVYWPLTKGECYIIIYSDALGKRVLEPDMPLALGWKQEQVMESVVTPMVDILQDFRDKDFFHGAIRPDNMFDGGVTQQVKKVILGDCLSLPPSYTQPALYETIERSMADPVARGQGTLSDDLYSFGASLAVFMRSQDPMSGLSDQDIIREKILNGSYAAITGKDRFKGSILELLRGLLHDDPMQRWTIDEVLVWLDGRRLSPKQALKKKKAVRPLHFGEERFLHAPLAAMSFASEPAETLKIVEDNTLDQWLERSLEDEVALKRMKEAVQSSAEGGQQGEAYRDRLVANVSCALDTMAPMRFRGVSAMGDGIGPALYETAVLKRDVKIFADMFLQSIALNWVTMSDNPNLDVTGLIGKFDSCRSFLRQSRGGYGIERCLYLLAPEAPCLSEKFKDYYVTSPEDMMYALEDLCKKGNVGTSFLDRHSIAFLSAKDSKLIDSYIYDLNAAEAHKNIFGTLKCLATIQKRSKMKNFPAIGKVLFKMLPTVLKRYHDQETRESLETNLKKMSESGDLVKMAGLLDNPDTLQRDFQAFRQAMTEYSELRQEHENLEKQLKNEKTFGRASGREFAALASGGFAMLVMLVTAFMFFTNKSIF